MQAVKHIQRQAVNVRQFHACTPRSFPRRVVGIPAPPQLQKTGLLFDEDDTTGADEQDTNEGTSAGHIFLGQQRQVLQYMRLIEHDMPKLVRMFPGIHNSTSRQLTFIYSIVEYRVPFTPPPSERPLVVRSIDYGGEQHPATTKRTVVVPVSRLPLKNDSSIHNVKLLAGPRWTIKPPSDSGIAVGEGTGEHGYIKISCEDFPESGMNLKWISDTLDRLVEQANVRMRRSSYVSISNEFFCPLNYSYLVQDLLRFLSIPDTFKRGDERQRLEKTMMERGCRCETSHKIGYLRLLDKALKHRRSSVVHPPLPSFIALLSSEFYCMQEAKLSSNSPKHPSAPLCCSVRGEPSAVFL